ncbi:PAS domain S-box protein [Bradyrhizobium sp.]|uniref:PAS domain S-box protein n=1 Tax=Bradyrhizobium sp. TaxID=376 RepID=UPI003C74AC63
MHSPGPLVVMTLSGRLAFAMVLLVAATTCALSLFTYYFVREATIPHALDRLATKAALGATELEAALSGARQDALMIQGGVAVEQLAATRTAGPIVPQVDAKIRESITARFLSILRAKSEYAQLRIIAAADGGRELVRVDRGGPGGAARAVPDIELTQEGERDYFKRTMSLSRSDVYVSPTMSGTDGGSGHPATPMLQIATPLPAPDGRPFGIGVIDLDLGPRFERIRAGIGGVNHVAIVNAAGDYLLDSGPPREIASGARSPARIQDDFPEFDRSLTGGGSGSGIWRDRNGEQYGVGWQTVRMAGGPGATILVATRYRVLNSGFSAVSRSALAGGGIAVLLALVLAIGIARSLSRPLTQMTRAVKGLSRGELVAMPSNGGQEIAILAAAFAEMSTQLGTKQKLLENTVESIRDSVVVADENGKIVVANAAARRLLGVDPGFSSAAGAQKFTRFFADGVTPLPVSSSPLMRALRGENVDDFELVVQFEEPGVRAYIVANARPLRDELGTLRGAVTVLRDTTEQRRAHQALVDSEQMAQAIIKTALDAFVQTNDKGVVLDWSPQAEALNGWTRAEAIGKKVVDLVFPESLRAGHRQRIARFLSEATGGATGMRYESRSLHKDGHEFLVEVSLTALRRGDGFIINAFIRDITRKRAAEEQLIQAQKMESVGQLTGGIAHDFNNMLTVITGTIEILADAVKDNAPLAAIAKMISEAADRAAQLTANLLAFARKQPLRPLEIDINALVREVVKLLLPTLGRQIKIQTTLSDQVWPALADPGQLSSAMVNLAINARDAMPSGGTLMFTTSNISLSRQEAAASGVDAGDYVVIEVADTGHGIPEAIRDRIFDPFFSTKQVGSGTGLGLSMVFGFAKQSGGNIEVRSEEGSGASFRIYLPKADFEPVQTSPVTDGELRGGSETILCVEDDDEVRAYVTGQLESLGYKVISTSGAAEALAVVEAGTAFDLLFSDIVMPGILNGRQLADRIAEQRPTLRVLFSSGYTDGAIPSQGRAGRDMPLLTKPYRRAELARALRHCLDTALDPAGDPIPLPYSVLPDLERFLRENPPKRG